MIPAELKTLLSDLDDTAVIMLEKAKAAGKTYIVTNAQDGWV
jgi:hypothetical protein